MAVDVLMISNEAREWEEWEGGEKRVASNNRSEKEEQHLWRLLEENDK